MSCQDVSRLKIYRKLSLSTVSTLTENVLCGKNAGFGRLFALHWFVEIFFSLSFSSYCLYWGQPSLIFSKFLLKFRNVSKHTVSRSSLACSQNIKQDILTAFGVFLCFETKRNDINRSCTRKIHATREQYPRKNWVP